jgi:large subunit ribosomal protein L7/L12
MTVIEMIALTKDLEQKWGVKAVPQMVQQSTQQDQKQESTQTEFSVVLVSFPADKKMAVVKLIREYLGMPLKESKDLAEAAPKALKTDMPKEEAEAMKAKFTEAGAVVEMR